MIKTPKELEDSNELVISLGDPAGIGTEVTLKALSNPDLPQNMHPLLIGCKKNIELNYKTLQEKTDIKIINFEKLKIIDIPTLGKIKFGIPSIDSGESSFKWLTHACEYVLKKKGKALITAPIAKYAWKEAGHAYGGQTERLAELCKIKKFSMLFTAKSPNNGWRMNTLLATTHIPLSQVAQTITPQLIEYKLDSLYNFCKKFNDNPRLSIAGLNPHAGEKGGIGNEEIQWLIPTIKKFQNTHPNVELLGPFAPDTCWLDAAKAWFANGSNASDGYLAMYHDQGLIPTKLLAFESAVNTTLGLPFIRTSPDHGTAFNIAGEGIANEQSMFEAINTAWELNQIKNTT